MKGNSTYEIRASAIFILIKSQHRIFPYAVEDIHKYIYCIYKHIYISGLYVFALITSKREAVFHVF